MNTVLVHTHFHRRRTGVTRSIENVFQYFSSDFESYIYGYGINGPKISTLKLLTLLFSKRKVVVHCHRNNELMRMLFFRFLGSKFKLIATRHAESKPSSLTLNLLKKADEVVTLIPSMSENLGIKNTIIGHGINTEDFTPNSDKSIPEIKEKDIILCAGRVRKSKGQETLITAVCPLLKENKDLALVVVGKVDKTSFLDDLKKIAKENNVENQVYFVDETSDIISYYQAAKIAVVPSFSEGFSLVTAEAMSCECTVIATKNVGVHSNLIKDKKTGYLFTAGNTDELQHIISNILSQKNLETGVEARKEIIVNWSAEKEAKQLINLYKS